MAGLGIFALLGVVCCLWTRTGTGERLGLEERLLGLLGGNGWTGPDLDLFVIVVEFEGGISMFCFSCFFFWSLWFSGFEASEQVDF